MIPSSVSVDVGVAVGVELGVGLGVGVGPGVGVPLAVPFGVVVPFPNVVTVKFTPGSFRGVGDADEVLGADVLDVPVVGSAVNVAVSDSLEPSRLAVADRSSLPLSPPSVATAATNRIVPITISVRWSSPP